MRKAVNIAQLNERVTATVSADITAGKIGCAVAQMATPQITACNHRCRRPFLIPRDRSGGAVF